MKRIILFLALSLPSLASCSKAVPSKSDIAASKNWPLVWALSQSPKAIAQLNADAVLSEIAAAKFAACSLGDEASAIEGLKWSSGQIDSASERLAIAGGTVTGIASDLRASGKYYIYNELSDSAFIAAAFRQDAEGMNHTFEVYAQGARPYYGDNDAATVEAGTRRFQKVAEDIRTTLLYEGADAFFSFPLKSAAAWLEANDRSEAADCEPLGKANRAAMKAVRGTDWKKYPYSLILVPGQGPDLGDQPLSPNGRQRARYAADLYLSGAAPFLVVSGGRVHPKRTPYIEAVEMRRYLVEEYGIPEKAVFIEPHARHTTTNIRNTVRIMMAAGIPLDKPALIATSRFQLDYIESEGFVNLCKRMMLTMPYTPGERIAARQLEFHPLPSAAQVSPVDPMDP